MFINVRTKPSSGSFLGSHTLFPSSPVWSLCYLNRNEAWLLLFPQMMNFITFCWQKALSFHSPLITSPHLWSKWAAPFQWDLYLPQVRKGASSCSLILPEFPTSALPERDSAPSNKRSFHLLGSLRAPPEQRLLVLNSAKLCEVVFLTMY